MAANTKSVTQLDFSGGSNLVVNPYLVSQKQAQEIENMVLDEHGSARTRDGVRTVATSPDLLSPILLRGNLIRNNGTEYPFAVQATLTGAANPVTVDTTSGANKTGSSGTMAFTCGASATVLLVAVYMDNSYKTVNSITYDSVSMSRIGSLNQGGTGLELWGLVGPTTGSSKTISVTLAGAPAGWRIQAISLIDAEGWGSPTTSQGGGGSSASVTLSSGTNHMAVGVFCKDVSQSVLTPSDTAIHQDNYSDNNRSAAQHDSTGAASVTLTYTGTMGDRWAFLGVDITPSGTGYTLYRTDTSPWTTIGALNTEDLPDVVYMSDKAVFLHGYAIPKTFDGAALANVTGGSGTAPAGAKHGVFHLGALWIWNTAATTSANDGPSSLEASATNDFNDWPPANQIFIQKDDGQEGMGIVPFTIVETGIAPTSTLVAFKNYRAFQITGTFGTSAFSIQPIKSDMGCIAPRSIQFVSGFGVIRLTHKGFALYNGVEDRLISEEVRPAIFGGSGFSALDFTNAYRCWAQQSQNPPLYICGAPVSGTGLTRFFVYDLVRRGWTLFTLPDSISCINLYFGRGQFPTLHLGTATGGEILEFFTGESTDNGDDIAWSFTTRTVFAGNPMTPSFWRRAQISLLGPPNTPITVTPIIERTERAAQHFTLPDSIDTEIEGVLAVDLMETAGFVQLRIEGTGPCRLRALEYQVAPKPSTKHISRR